MPTTRSSSHRRSPEVVAGGQAAAARLAARRHRPAGRWPPGSCWSRWPPPASAGSAARSSWPRRCCCSAPARSTTAAPGVRGPTASCAGWTTPTSTSSSPRPTPRSPCCCSPARSRVLLLSLIWAAALGGLLFRLVWLTAPRWLYTALYLVMGWAALGWLGAFYANGGPGGVHPDPGRRALLHRRRRGLRPAPAQPVPGLVRLPRDLPRRHDRRLRLPLHRDLAGHLRRRPA